MRGYFGNENEYHGSGGRGMERNRTAQPAEPSRQSSRPHGILPKDANIPALHQMMNDRASRAQTTAKPSVPRLRDDAYDMSKQLLFGIEGVFGKLSVSNPSSNDENASIPVTVALNPRNLTQAQNVRGKQEFVTAAKMVVGTFIKRQYIEEQHLGEKTAETQSRRYTISFQPPI